MYSLKDKHVNMNSELVSTLFKKGRCQELLPSFIDSMYLDKNSIVSNFSYDTLFSIYLNTENESNPTPLEASQVALFALSEYDTAANVFDNFVKSEKVEDFYSMLKSINSQLIIRENLSSDDINNIVSIDRVTKSESTPSIIESILRTSREISQGRNEEDFKEIIFSVMKDISARFSGMYELPRIDRERFVSLITSCSILMNCPNQTHSEKYQGRAKIFSCLTQPIALSTCTIPVFVFCFNICMTRFMKIFNNFKATI